MCFCINKLFPSHYADVNSNNEVKMHLQCLYGYIKSEYYYLQYTMTTSFSNSLFIILIYKMYLNNYFYFNHILSHCRKIFLHEII